MKKCFFRKFSPTSYVKLQDAYVAEAAKVGSWTVIGYVAPGAANAAAGDVAGGSSTTNFTYTPSTSLTGADGSATIGTVADAWTATAKVALNDCTTSTGIWKVGLAAASTGDAVLYTAITPSCGEALTPTFNKIGK